MVNNSIIPVKYTVYASNYSIRHTLPKVLESLSTVSFDCETRSMYPKEERQEAKNYLKDVSTSDPLYAQARVVANSSGLSYPSIIKTTHFIFGESKDKSYIAICDDPELEMFLWGLVANYKGKLLVHNSLFDLKICYQRTGKLPINAVDTALMVKGLINHVNIWKAKTGLKGLMGEYYNPKWSILSEDYEPIDLKGKDFLEYCAIDGCSTVYLHELILEEYKKLGIEPE